MNFQLYELSNNYYYWIESCQILWKYDIDKNMILILLIENYLCHQSLYISWNSYIQFVEHCKWKIRRKIYLIIFVLFLFYFADLCKVGFLCMYMDHDLVSWKAVVISNAIFSLAIGLYVIHNTIGKTSLNSHFDQL